MADGSIPPLWYHQIKAIEKARELDEFALLWEPGTGKTRGFIEMLRDKVQKERRLLKTLILGPVITVRNWRDEFAKYTKVDMKDVVTLEGSEKDRLHKLTINCFSMESPNKIIITNYEALQMEGLYELLLKWQPEVMCFDEMHKLKDHTTKRSKACRKLAEGSKYRFGLTGTAVLNSLMDVFGQWLCLDQGKTFGRNFFSFRNEYFYDKNSGMPKHCHFPKWIPRTASADLIKLAMAKRAQVVEKGQVLQLPPLIRQTIHVDPSKEQKKHYDALKNDFITWLESQGTASAVVAQSALTRSLRLMQLTSGYLKNDQGEEIDLKTNPKAEALEELLETLLPNKVIIWACFIRNYEQIKKVCNKLKVNYVECHGGISNPRKFAAVEQFNSDPDTKVFIGHPASLGIGINLCPARYMVYYSRGYSLGDDIQSEARNYRAGSEIHESVTRYDIVMDGTIDEEAVKALHNKQDISLSVLRGWL